MELTSMALALAKAGGPKAAAAAYRKLAPQDWAKRLATAALRKGPRPRPQRALAKLLRRDGILERIAEAIAGDVSGDPTLVADVDDALSRSWRWRRLSTADRRSRAKLISHQVVSEFVSALDPARAVAVTSAVTRQAISDLGMQLEGQRDLIAAAVAEQEAGAAKGLLARLHDQLQSLPAVTHAELEAGLEADPEGIAQLIRAVATGAPQQTLRDWIERPPSWLGTTSSPERATVWDVLGELAWAYDLGHNSSVAFEAAALASAGERRSYLLARAALAACMEENRERVSALLASVSGSAHPAIRVATSLQVLLPVSQAGSRDIAASTATTDGVISAERATESVRGEERLAPGPRGAPDKQRQSAREALAAWQVTSPPDREIWARAAVFVEMTDDSRTLADRYKAAGTILERILADGWVSATALILARILTAHAHLGVSSDRAGDLHRAEELAVRVRDDARSARADSRVAVRVATAAAGQRNQPSRVIALGSRDFGEATAEEAADIDVFRYLITAAIETNHQIAETLAGDLDRLLPEGYLRRWTAASLAERPTIPELDRDRRLELWRLALAAATNEDEKRESLRGLAFAGAVDLPGLDDLMADAPWVAAHWRAASAMARQDPAEAVRILHPYRLAAIPAAGLLAEAYGGLGQTDAAVDVLTAAADKFDADDLLGRAAMLRIAAGEREEAERILSGVLSTASQHWAGRSQALEQLGNLQASRGDLTSATSSWKSAIEANPRADTARWNLAGALAGQGEYQEAWTVLVGAGGPETEVDVLPDPPNAAAARLLLILIARRSDVDIVVSRGLELLERFADDPDFVGRTLALLLGVRVADPMHGAEAGMTNASGDGVRASATGSTRAVGRSLSPELSDRLNQAIATYTAAHPNSRYLQAITGSTEELIAAMNARGRPDEERRTAVVDALLAIQRGALPLGMLPGLVDRHYTEVIVTHEAGVLTSVGDAAEHQACIADAFDALAVQQYGADSEAPRDQVLSVVSLPTAEVVVDPTTLYVRSLLRDLDQLITTGFREVSLSEDAYLDVIATRDRFALPQTGAWAVDPDSGTGYFVPLPAATLAVRRSQISAVADLAHACRRLPTPTTANPVLDQIDDPRLAPWTSGIRLASARGAALWADDIGIRAVARQLGILTFSTPALLQAHHHLGRLDPDQLEHALCALILGCVGDLAPNTPRLRALAAKGSDSRGAVVSAFTKPTFWQDYSAAASAYERLVSDFADTSPDVVADIVYVALVGVCRLGLPTTTLEERGARLLADSVEALPTPAETPRLLAAARSAFANAPDQPDLLPRITLRLLAAHERRVGPPLAAGAVRALFATCSAEDQTTVANIILNPRRPC